MTSTFYLKSPNSDVETLILFSCYFKLEGKKFVYSTGEKILPIEWDQNSKSPITRGKNKCKYASTINGQLGRYSLLFDKMEARCKAMDEDFTSQLLKKEFDQEFKKAPTGKNIFFDAYDEFINLKIKNMDWAPSTKKRYKNIKNILESFEVDKKYNLTFSSINQKFLAEFTDYCMTTKKHINNTYSRNLGLFKTFMYWALENNYTYNEEFKKFKRKERVITNQVALEKVDLVKLLNHNFKSESLEKIRDVFVFSCTTGMRFGELKLISENNISGNTLQLKEEKGSSKDVRSIPLSDIARYILKKYDYQLPLISNQKHNDYIKDVFKLAGFTQKVEKASTRGKEVIRESMFFYDRVSTHTARRTFITMMKREGKSDKLISKITGHNDLKTLNAYYQVEDNEKKEAVDQVFNFRIPLLKKA
ncbi:tyrosine-type recombinase/integrase [Leeuwenhoekiella sp. NPDC079379]|uniref:tyrosine-type recombinase/integrase n=1 Tax=Leeuwenhoekiella sp. NPDC079379 TaxID=3364122 RepID=UPI0037C604A0